MPLDIPKMNEKTEQDSALKLLELEQYCEKLIGLMIEDGLMRRYQGNVELWVDTGWQKRNPPYINA